MKPKVTIEAIRSGYKQITVDGGEELTHFEEFLVTDNGQEFTKENYASFLEAYSTLKLQKGCKGIGRFLWLKAFEKVEVKSVYLEDGKWYKREFSFSVDKAIEPEEKCNEIDIPEDKSNRTEVHLIGFKFPYKKEVALAFESLAKKIIEHCLPYFIIDNCPEMEIIDSDGGRIKLNEYYNNLYLSGFVLREVILFVF